MRVAITTAFALVLLAHQAAAQTAAPVPESKSDAEKPAEPEKSFWERDTLLGDLGGVRSKLVDHGITFGLIDTEEGFANLSGGLRRSTVYEGLTQVSLKLDTAKLGLWEGGTFYASLDQIHGRGPSRYLVGNLQTLSSIESQQSTKLYDLYYEHALLNNALSIRVGQFGADEEFTLTSYGAGFVNSNFGFPVLPAVDLPNGGPAYPLAALGARVKYAATDQITLLGAAFNGDPISPYQTAQNTNGTDFRWNPPKDGVFMIGEMQYAMNQGEKDAGLPGTYRLGMWYHTGAFNNYTARTAVSFANPYSGTGAKVQNNYSVYAVADQLVWRMGEKSGDSADPAKQRGIGVFARLMGSPSQQNQITFAASGGVVWKGPLDARQDDQIGLGVNYTVIGSAYRAQQRAAGLPAPSSETVFEVNYLAQLTGWLQVQPSLEYVVRPGGGVPNPNAPGVIKNATVVGLRSIVTF